MPRGRPKGSKNAKNNMPDSLERFAIRIEDRLRQGDGSITMEQLVCRALTNQKNPFVASGMLAKWVEWRYGAPKQHSEHVVKMELSITDADRIIAEYFIATAQKTLGVSASDSDETPQQVIDILPA